jgi:hypothetical protein
MPAFLSSPSSLTSFLANLTSAHFAHHTLSFPPYMAPSLLFTFLCTCYCFAPVSPSRLLGSRLRISFITLLLTRSLFFSLAQSYIATHFSFYPTTCILRLLLATCLLFTIAFLNLEFLLLHCSLLAFLLSTRLPLFYLLRSILLTFCYVHICMSHIKDEMSVKKEEWFFLREGAGRAPLNTR